MWGEGREKNQKKTKKKGGGRSVVSFFPEHLPPSLSLSHIHTHTHTHKRKHAHTLTLTHKGKAVNGGCHFHNPWRSDCHSEHVQHHGRIIAVSWDLWFSRAGRTVQQVTFKADDSAAWGFKPRLRYTLFYFETCGLFEHCLVTNCPTEQMDN